MIENSEMPYLSVAAICQHVLQEKDEVLSAIRLVDTLKFQRIQGETTPEGHLPQLAVSLIALLAFKGGPARGKRTVMLQLYSPDGSTTGTTISYPLVFTKEDHANNVIVNLALLLKDEGLHWLEVTMDGKILTRMPLIVQVSRELELEERTPQHETLPTVAE